MVSCIFAKVETDEKYSEYQDKYVNGYVAVIQHQPGLQIDWNHVEEIKDGLKNSALLNAYWDPKEMQNPKTIPYKGVFSIRIINLPFDDMSNVRGEVIPKLSDAIRTMIVFGQIAGRVGNSAAVTSAVSVFVFVFFFNCISFWVFALF